jgi:hypothetical protein
MQNPSNSHELSLTGLNITIEQFLCIQQNNLSLDLVYLLDRCNRHGNVLDLQGNLRVQALIQNLVRRGLISQEGELTIVGRQTLLAISEGVCDLPTGGVFKKQMREATQESFDTWWMHFPATDIFSYNGRKFRGTRGFKCRKIDCKKLYTKIISEGEYSAEDLLRALKYEIEIKKENSFATGENKLKYLANTYTYLYQRLFENFIEISKEQKPGGENGQSIDI